MKLVLVEKNKPSRRHLIGSGIGKIWMADDFNSLETNAEVADLFEGGRDLE